jgi:hypothetical protein
MASFMKCFKCETAHALNGILGRGQRTVWRERYDSPYIPDLETAIQKIAYIYSNPSNDYAVDSIERFPGFNTFELRAQMATGEKTLEEVNFPTYLIPRPEFTKIQDHTPEGYTKYRARLIHKKKRTSVVVNPNALFHKFGITNEAEIRRLNSVIVAEIRCREEKNRAQRQAEGRSLIGARRLISTPIGTPYTPHRTGRRMRVHSHDRELRIQILAWMRKLYRKARAVFDRWKLGDYSVPFPMGLFPPSNIRLVEPLGW